VYCPQCRAEYREGFTECSDCRVPLVSEKPELKPPGDPDLEWVTVFEGGDPLLIGAAKELLEQAGIPSYVLGGEIGARYAVVGEYIHPWRKLKVGCDRETEAREVLRRFEEAELQ
jgi:putative signal transducing protein